MRTIWGLGIVVLWMGCGESDKSTVEEDVVVDQSNTLPTIEIIAPQADESFFSNLPVSMVVQVTDAEDDVTDLSLSVLSDLTGSVSAEWSVDEAGVATTEIMLSQGVQTLSIQVEDTQGASETATVALDVLGPNTNPTCAIVAPATEMWFETLELIELVGMVSDAEQSASDLIVEWVDDSGTLDSSTPDAQGNVVTNIPFGEGRHALSMVVDDGYGGGCSDSIVLNVGYPPEITVRSPSDASVVVEGDIVNLWVDVSDVNADGDPQESTVVWESDLDGLLFEGVTEMGTVLHSLDELSAGLHTLTVTATDIETLTSSETIEVRVNRLPEIQSISLAPNPIYTTDALVATVLVGDPDGDATSVQYQWYENGQLTGVLGNIVPSTDVHAGDEWRLVATPNDGYHDGEPVEASILVSNTPPAVANVAISPNATVYNDETVSCTSAVSDPDQTIIPVYQWTVGGTAYISNSIDLSMTVAMPGDTVLCEVFATDDDGVTTTGSDSLLLSNRAPTVSQVSIDLTNPTTNEVVSCSAMTTDLDGETLTETYAWQVGGTTVATGQTVDITTLSVNPTDVLSCVVDVVDGLGETATDSATVVLQNTPPVVNTVNLSPASPTAVDTLTCIASASDADGETLDTVLQFSHQGINLYTANATSATFHPPDYGLSSGDQVLCTAIVSDGYGGSDQSSDSVTLDSSAPSLSGLFIAPNTAYTGSTLFCSGTASDPNDGDLTSSIQYQWQINGVSVGTGATYTVQATQSNVGDSVVCQATVVDSDGESDTLSTSVLVQNTEPTVDAVSIAPSVAYNNDVVTCTASVSDPDGTPVVSYEWSVNGAIIETASALDLDTTALMPNETVLCTATATDGSNAQSTGSASLTLANRAPTSPVVEISWSGNSGTAIAGNPLTCSATALDFDGQPLTYTFGWASSAGGTASGATLSATQIQGGETWTCTATATDGQFSTSGSTSVYVLEPCVPDTDYDTLDLGGLSDAELVRVCAGDDGQGRYSISKDLMVMTTEVTQGMFVDLMQYDPTTYGNAFGIGNDHPVYYVNWHMATDFANQMTQRHNAVLGTNLSNCYVCNDSLTESVSCSMSTSTQQCDGYRLPTEAEWEYTARVGTDQEFWTADGGGSANSSACYSIIPIQDGGATPNLDAFAWYCYNRYDSTYYNTDKPVGLKSPNGFGVYDMHGNVSEWTADRWGCTFPVESVDPLCTITASKHTIRGGDWTGNASTIRSSERSSLNAFDRVYKQGFRVVRDL